MEFRCSFNMVGKKLTEKDCRQFSDFITKKLNQINDLQQSNRKLAAENERLRAENARLSTDKTELESHRNKSRFYHIGRSVIIANGETLKLIRYASSTKIVVEELREI